MSIGRLTRCNAHASGFTITLDTSEIRRAGNMAHRYSCWPSGTKAADREFRSALRDIRKGEGLETDGG